MFFKGDRKSIELMVNAFDFFTKASGLMMNRSKSNFYCNGLAEHLIKGIEDETGMHRGTVPFKYLGINVSPKRLSVLDCTCLVDKVVDRIRGMGARKLSYAGRVVLIRSVLSTLHSYWARIFVIPKTVIKRIESMCKGFLWHGNEQNEGPALVSWDSICQPIKQGGLGIRKLHEWNIAALGKYVWWIEQKADHLWVKWVHAVDIKGKDWKDYEPTINSSWAWWKICQVRTVLRQVLYGRNGPGGSYSATQGYKFLVPEGEKVSWYPWIRTGWIIPRHRFLIWLVAQQRLLTQDRLQKMGIVQTNVCFLCGVEEESHEHLFFRCVYSERCWALVAT
ncbi:uncharacterized protein LOC141597407 isoform X1 [Silene latifolia]|uniref:uncharacterized protein LOC141597407 isoform X1 n=1 Tax=Silene latifolia TaxID=37657 RepID=UPI003D771A38